MTKYLRLVGQGKVVVGYYPVSLPKSVSPFSVPLDKPLYMALTRVDLVDVPEPPVGEQAPNVEATTEVSAETKNSDKR